MYILVDQYTLFDKALHAPLEIYLRPDLRRCDHVPMWVLGPSYMELE